MNLKRLIIAIFLILNLNISALAKESFQKTHLTEAQVERVKVLEQSIGDVDSKTLPQMINELERTKHPEVALLIKEAMAKAYADIVKEEGVQAKHKKEWLYSMVALNMAYFQFGGDKDSAGGTKNLNKLIRFKLKSYLPSDIYDRPGFHASIG